MKKKSRKSCCEHFRNKPTGWTSKIAQSDLLTPGPDLQQGQRMTASVIEPRETSAINTHVSLYVCLIKKLKVKDLVWKVLCWFSHFHRRFPLMPSCLYITVLLQGYGGNDCKRFALTMSSISPVKFNACSFIFNKGQISLYKEIVMSSEDMIGPSVLRFNRIHCVFSLCV